MSNKPTSKTNDKPQTNDNKPELPEEDRYTAQERAADFKKYADLKKKN